MAAPADIFEHALRHHQAGNLAFAEQLYRQLLQAQPTHCEGHHMLGVLAYQSGRFDVAVTSIRQALSIHQSAEYLNNLGLALEGSGDLKEAVTSYHEALHLQPDMAEAHNNLGNALLRQSQNEEAQFHYEQALLLQEDYAAAHCGLGLALANQGKWAEAEAHYRDALRLNPNYAEAHNNLAGLFCSLGKADEAVIHCQQALLLQPGFPEAQVNLGNALVLQQKWAEGEAHLREAIRLNPLFAEAHRRLGDLLRRQGALADAAAACQEAIRLKPDYTLAFVTLALVQQAANRLPEALATLEKAAQVQPDQIQVYNLLGNIYFDLGDLEQAVVHYRRAVSFQPNFAEGHAKLGIVLGELDEKTEAEKHFQEALRLYPHDKIRVRLATMLPAVYQSVNDIEAWRLRLTENVRHLRDEGVALDLNCDTAQPVFYLAYQGLNDRDLQHQIAGLFSGPPEFATRPAEASPSGAGKINLALISHCFRNHSVGHWMRGLVAKLSRSVFDVTVLSVGSYDDEISALFKQQADRFIEVPPDLPMARRLIADQRFDVLLYTDIGQDPITRTLAFSRLAPVQCTTLGHPVTSGLDTIDYYISAEDLEIPQAQEHYTESLVRLPHLPVYFYRPQPPPGVKTRDDFGLAEDDHVYACLQYLFKFHPDFDEILANILHGDPKGIVVMSIGKVPAWQRLLSRRFTRTLPDVLDRIRFLPHLSYPDYLDLLCCVDVQLDPIHFGGGMTSYEALALGIPIVTLPSEFCRGRFTYALYKQLHILDCVAQTPQEYVQKALKLGNDCDYRRAMQQRILAANDILFENDAGIRDLEQFLKTAVDDSWKNRPT